ncbi:MAG: acyltransferase [Verrucomicrobiales bacterium]|nr:acyltransferase [Verrucomicrobiales bacterium]MCP5560029.1 acyltransferase [Verrucomicrobiaceae bacterium]
MNSKHSLPGVRLPGATVATIDLMRGVLAILVLVAHTVETARISAHLPVTGKGCTWLPTLVMQGGFWVGGFFVLSGFCVHLSVKKLLERGQPWLREYTWARATRIYPMFLLSLILFGASWLWLGPYPANQGGDPVVRGAWHLVMLQGITGVFHELKPAWSLTYEMIYYAAWPALILLAGGRVGRALWLGAGLAMAVTAVVVIFWKVAHGGSAASWLIPFWLISAQFLLWLGGAFLAHSWSWVSVLNLQRLGGLAVLGLIGFFGLQGWLVQHDARQWMLLLCGYAALPCWLLLLVASAHFELVTKWGWLVRRMALLSYPLYLLHQLVLDAASRLWESPTQPMTFGFLLGAFTLGVVWLAGIPAEWLLLRWRSVWLKKMAAGGLQGGGTAAHPVN